MWNLKGAGKCNALPFAAVVPAITGEWNLRPAGVPERKSHLGRLNRDDRVFSQVVFLVMRVEVENQTGNELLGSQNQNLRDRNNE